MSKSFIVNIKQFAKNFFNSKKPRLRAFSLVEISVAILIIGVLVGGVVLSNTMITQARVKSAIALTTSSPVLGIENNAVWLETTLDTSFDSTNMEDGALISTWNNQSSSANKTNITAVNDGAQYSGDINRINALKFDGSDVNYLEIADASFLNHTDYTIFITEKRADDSTLNYFLGSPVYGSADDSLNLGYNLNSTITHAQGTNSYESGVSAYSDSANKARVFSFVQSSTGGKTTYINGVLANEDPDNTAQLSGITSLAIGKGYSGEIGEIIIFTHPLRDDERESIEDYLGDKWYRPINRDIVAGGSCIGGIVTDTGCSMDCNVTNPGVSTPTKLIDGESVNATCSVTGYTGNITLYCTNGAIEITSGGCTIDVGYEIGDSGLAGLIDGYIETDDGAVLDDQYYELVDGTPQLKEGYEVAGDSIALSDNYELIGDSTDPQLENGYTLTNDGTVVCDVSFEAIGTSSDCTAITCAINGVTGLEDQTVSYTADETEITCITGYSSSITYTCETTDAISITGTCTQNCDVSSVYGAAVTSIIDGSSSIACSTSYANVAGTDITLDTACSDGTAVTGVNCACDTGYTINTTGDACIEDSCTVSEIGVTTTTVDAGSSSLLCDDSTNNFNATDSIGYTCAAGVFSLNTDIDGIEDSCSCTDGYTIDDSNVCIENSCSISALGVTSTASVTPASNVTLTCDDTVNNFTGSTTYNCVAGTFTETGSCSCASGYSLISGVCKQQCAAPTGTTATYLDEGTTSLACNYGHYDALSVSFTCASGAVTSGSCDSCSANYDISNNCETCLTGYTLSSGCTTCDTGYSGTSCAKNCSLSDITGYNGVVAYAAGGSSGSLTCNEDGFDSNKSIAYDCTSAGVLTTTGSCTCDTGYGGSSGTNCSSCATNYVDTDSSSTVACERKCLLSSVNGISSPTYVTETSTETFLTCNDSNYNGSSTSLSYTCGSDGVLATTGSCSCASGYDLVGSTCKKQCTISDYGTLYGADSAVTSVSNGSGTISCTGSRYNTNSSNAINYTCDNGTLSISQECSCSSDTYEKRSDGKCQIKACSLNYIIMGVDYDTSAEYPYTSGSNTYVYGKETSNGDGTFSATTQYLPCETPYFSNSSSDKIPYTCEDGAFDFTTDRETCLCGTGYQGTNCNSCADGYSITDIYGTQCILNCPVSVPGVTTTSVAYNNYNDSDGKKHYLNSNNSDFGDFLSCNDTGYDSSDKIAYVCGNLADRLNLQNSVSGYNRTCSCATGYTGTNCSTCDTDNGYGLNNGSCVICTSTSVGKVLDNGVCRTGASCNAYSSVVATNTAVGSGDNADSWSHIWKHSNGSAILQVWSRSGDEKCGNKTDDFWVESQGIRTCETSPALNDGKGVAHGQVSQFNVRWNKSCSSGKTKIRAYFRLECDDGIWKPTTSPANLSETFNENDCITELTP